MTQSSTLGAVPTSSGATVRSNLNLSDQALATDNAGASAPSPAYPNMRWNDGTQVWRRNSGNTGWDLALDGQGFRNRIINGNFDIWQRGTSLGSGSGARYLADRWRSASIGSTYTVSQQPFSVGDTTVSAQAVNFHRVVVTSVANAANYCVLAQRIEGVRRLASKTATIALWAKADASKPMAIDLAQCFGTGGSPSSTVSAIGATKVNLTTSWQKLTVTASVPSISGKTLGSNGDDYLELNLLPAPTSMRAPARSASSPARLTSRRYRSRKGASQRRSKCGRCRPRWRCVSAIIK